MSAAIDRTEIDGVPLFYTDAENVQPFAAIEFRAGRADEPFRLAGITHVVEHLAFHQVGERPFPVNGFVDHVETVFHAGGRPDENAAFIAAIAGAVADLDTSRLGQELGVLRVEAGQRGPSVVNAQFTYRYGTEGPGRAAMGEHALQGVTGEEVRAWSRDRFNRGAVAWMSFPPPAGFSLAALPEGPRRPVALRRNIDPLPLPSFGFVAQLGGVSVGGPIARTTAGAAGSRILRNRMERRLRRDLGLSYETSLAYVPLDGLDAYLSFYASCQEADVARVGAEVIALAEELAAAGPTPEELAEDLDGYLRATDDPHQVLGTLARAASSELLGHPHDTPEELLAELRALTPDEVAAAMETFTAGAIGLGSAIPALTGRWKPYPMWSQDAVEGRRFEHKSKKYPWTRDTPVIVVAPDGISQVNPAGQPITVRYVAAAGVLRYSGNRRVVQGADGFQVRVDPAEWKDGDRLVAEIDRASTALDQVTFEG